MEQPAPEDPQQQDPTKQERWAAYLESRTNLEEAKDLLSTECDRVEFGSRGDAAANKQPATPNQMRRFKAELLFFDPRRNKNEQLDVLLKKIRSHRYRCKDEDVNPISLGEGTNARLLITVERLYQERIIPLCQNAEKIDRVLPVCKTTQFGAYYLFYGPPEKYRIGETIVVTEHRTEQERGGSKEPAAQTKERLGDSYVSEPFLGNYGNILKELNSCILKENFTLEELVCYLLEFGTHHRAAARTNGGPLPEREVNFMNAFSFLVMGKEQAQWQSASYFNQSRWNLGMTVSFARIMRLLQEKTHVIKLEDVFRPPFLRDWETGFIERLAKFGLYTTKNMYQESKEVSNVCDRVDELYQKAFDVELTTQQAHKDLLYAYGGSADSDGESYSED